MMVFAIVFGLIILGQLFLFKKPPANQQKSDANPTSQSSTTTTQSSAPPSVTAAATPAKPGVTPATTAVSNKSAGSETETVVENDLYKIVFTNRGAEVKSWILKKYKDDDGKPLDLVNKETTKFGLPLGLYTYDENLRSQINSALYVASSTGTFNLPGELSFRLRQRRSRRPQELRLRHDLRYLHRNIGHPKRTACNCAAALAGRVRRRGYRSQLRRAKDRIHGRRQGGAPCRQEDQQRQYVTRAIQLGRPAGSVLRVHLPAGQSRQSLDGHAARVDPRSQGSQEA